MVPLKKPLKLVRFLLFQKRSKLPESKKSSPLIGALYQERIDTDCLLFSVICFVRPKPITHWPIFYRESAGILSPTKNQLVWGASRQDTIKLDLVGRKLNMFDFQTS